MCSHEPYEHVLCTQCDLVVSLPKLQQGSKATCPRCRTTLIAQWRYPYRQPAAYAASALIMLSIASLFPLRATNNLLEITVTAFHGRYDGTALIQGYWTFTTKEAVTRHHFSIELEQQDAGYPALVRTLAQGWQQLAEDIAQQLPATL